MKELLRKTLFYSFYKKLKAKIALIMNWNPSIWMFVIWVTGTDWKTTTVNLLHKILNDYLWKTVLISTLNIKIWDEDIFNEAKMTSLDPMQLQKILAYAKEKWCKYAVLEVSSHWLDQYRFEWVTFDMGILTNITSEHLDYHKNIENYANTKKQLFTGIIKNSKQQKYAVFPKDNEFWRIWADELSFDMMMDYSIMMSWSIKADNIEEKIDGTTFVLKYLWNNYTISTSLCWRFNVYNILAAISAWKLLGIPFDAMITSIAQFKPLPWRQQFLEHNDIRYFVDFAHTPNWLESVLKYLNNVKGTGKVITVFGAPWERDNFKRPIMWKAANTFSDIVILTDDDPAWENRYDIIAQVSKWITKIQWKDFFILPEREHAIWLAIKMAMPWDVVLLAGKWHERVQLTNYWKRPWNDMDVLKKLLWVSKDY